MATVPTCARCSEPITPGARFCMKCGADISGEQGSVATAMLPAAQERDENEALLLLLRQVTVGDYEILSELGRGGMATVYLAHDIALDRKVAIKVMAPALMMMGEGMVERFKREARTSASLSHPHIIPIYGVKSQGNTLFFIMKFIAGRSLESIIRDRGAMPIPMVRALLGQVGSALGYAHRRGVVHRDVKPANIMIDEEGWAVVTDFGIAKVAESRGLTMTGIAVGTPSYMSPEQCAAKDITGKSDQYSLGVVAYEMLTGKQPFEADSAMAIMFAHFHEQPKPIRDLRPDCPAEIANAVMRMLEKAPEARWPTMEDAIGAIGAPPLGHDDPLRHEMIELARRGTARLKLDAIPPPPTSPVPPARPSGDKPARPSGAKTTPVPAPRAVTVAIAPASSSLDMGDTMQLTATPRAGGGTMIASLIRWASDAPNIATVSASGLVTAVGPGTASITASADDASGVATVRVTPVPVAVVVVAPSERALKAAETAQLEAVVRDRHDAVLKDRSVAWVSESPAVATVSPTGLVTGVAQGSARITATSEGIRGAATIRVSPAAVASLTLVAPPQLTVGEAIQLSAIPKDAKGGGLTGRSVSWQSSAPGIASVALNGTLTAFAPGSATITAECEGHQATATVTVKPVAVAAVVIAEPKPVIVGQNTRLTATVKDARGGTLAGRVVSWSSSAPKIATVSSTGEVTAVAPGTSKVSAECEGKSSTVTVTVTQVPVDNVKIFGAPGGLEPGESARLTGTAYDAKGDPLSGREIVWTSSDARIISVAKDGSLVARKPGNANLVASCEGKQAQIRLTVAAAAKAPEAPAPSKVEPPHATIEMPGAIVPPPREERRTEPVVVPDRDALASKPKRSLALPIGIVALLTIIAGWLIFKPGPAPEPGPIPQGPAAPVINSITVSTPEGPVNSGRTVQLSATVKDAAGADVSNSELSWTSSDESVATVSRTGAVFTHKPGPVTISASGGGKTGTIVLTVEAAPANEVAVGSLNLGPPPAALEVGESAQLAPVVKDTKGQALTDRTVVYASNNPRVATVSSTGVISAVGAGTAIITASSENKSAEVKVTVNKAAAGQTTTVAAISLTSKGQTVTAGETFQLAATPLDKSRKPIVGEEITWTSSDPRVATISSDGLVTAIAEGSATITASASGKSESAKITVPKVLESHVAAAAVVVTGASHALKVGATATLTASVRDAHGIVLDRTVSWSSNNAQVATVSGGVVTGVGPGTADISALSEGKTGTWSIEVAAAGGPVATTGGTGAAGSALLPRRSIAAGGVFTCGVAGSGQVVCWGAGRDGLVALAGVSGLSGLSLGAGYGCGLAAGGKAFCWGDNKSGQLGDGSTTSRTDAVAVSGDLSFSQISVGNAHTCGLIGGKAYCWGKNDKGQLGDGTTTDRKKPAPVKGGASYASISAGGGHTCALTSNGKAYCWGDGWSGALGYGDAGQQTEPTEVSGNQSFSAISSGGAHTCALTAAGKAYCWGDNRSGEVGDGSNSDRLIPVAVSGGQTFSDLSAGGSFTCGISTSGEVLCWGENKTGQLGDGSKTNRSKPAAIIGGSSFSGISAGSGHACGITKAGDPVCWGRNDKGQLGNGGTANRLEPGPVTGS